jgi:hypothetical protein
LTLEALEAVVLEALEVIQCCEIRQQALPRGQGGPLPAFTQMFEDLEAVPSSMHAVYWLTRQLLVLIDNNNRPASMLA